MTRGQKGCYIYCTNKELADYFKLAYNHQLSYTYNKSKSVLTNQPVAADKMSFNKGVLNTNPHKL